MPFNNSKENEETPSKKSDVKVISEGGYGCVVTPKISCSGRPTRNEQYITKIQRKNFFSENEVYISELVKKINKYSNFFSVIESSCSVPLRKITSKSIRQCKSTLDKVSVALLAQIRYIESKDIFDLLILTPPKSAVLHIINSFKILLLSIEKLATFDIIHFDLKADNILFDLVRRTPIIIDFGISIHKKRLVTMKDYENHFYVFYPKYYVWCLDVHYICYLVNVNKNPTIDEIKGLCHDYVSEHQILKSIFSPSFIKKYEALCVEALKRYIGKNHMTVIKQLLEYSPSWDMFSVANVYLKVIRFWFSDKFSDNNFIILFTQLLTSAIHPFCEKRPTVKQIQEDFNAIFHKESNFFEMVQIVNSLQQREDIVKKRVMSEKTKLKHLEKSIRTR